MYMIKMSDLNPVLLCSVITTKVSSRFKKQVYSYTNIRSINTFVHKEAEKDRQTHFLCPQGEYTIYTVCA